MAEDGPVYQKPGALFSQLFSSWQKSYLFFRKLSLCGLKSLNLTLSPERLPTPRGLPAHFPLLQGTQDLDTETSRCTCTPPHPHIPHPHVPTCTSHIRTPAHPTPGHPHTCTPAQHLPFGLVLGRVEGGWSGRDIQGGGYRRGWCRGEGPKPFVALGELRGVPCCPPGPVAHQTVEEFEPPPAPQERCSGVSVQDMPGGPPAAQSGPRLERPAVLSQPFGTARRWTPSTAPPGQAPPTDGFPRTGSPWLSPCLSSSS